MIDGGLAVLNVERSGFEENIGLGGFEPGADIVRSTALLIRTDAWVGQECPSHTGWIQAVGIGEPAEAAGGDAGDAEGDVVASPEFWLAIL